MVSAFMNGFAIIAAAAAIWFGGQMAFTLLVRPARRNLIDGIAYLRAHNELTETEDHILSHLRITACAVRATALVSLSYLVALIMPSVAILRERDEFARAAPTLLEDDKFDDIMAWYFVSIFAANPLFGIVALVLRWAFRLKLTFVLRSLHDQDHVYELPSLEAAQKA